MATLPRSPIANNVTNNYRPVREARANGADPVGQAIGQAGDAGFEIASRMADAKIATQAAQVELELENRLDQERRALEDDNEVDPASLEAMFQERASKAVSEIGGKISSPALKRAFGMKSAETVQRNTFQVRDVSRRKQVDLARGEFVTTMDTYSKTYDDPSNYLQTDVNTPSAAQARLESQQSYIKTQLRAGVITAETAADQSLKAQDAFKKGLERKHLKAIDDALDNGDYSGADSYFLAHSGEIDDPDVREKTRDIIEAKKRDGEAVLLADQYWADAKGDYGAFIAKASQIENVDERLAVEARGAQLKNQGDAAKAAKADKDMAEGMTFITQGKAPPSQWLRDADPEVAYTVQERWRARQEQALRIAGMTPGQRGTAAQISMGAYRSLKAELNGSEYGRELGAKGIAAVLADPELRATYDQMLPDEQGQFELDLANAAANGGVATDTVSKAYRGVAALASAYMPKNTVIPQSFTRTVTGGLGSGDPGAGKKTEGARMVEGEILRLVAEEVQRTGGADIPEPRARQIIALAYGNVGGNAMTGETAYPLAPDVAGDIMQTEARRTILDFRSQNPDLWSTTASMVRSKYPEASDAVVLEEARRIMAYRDAEQIVGNLRGMFGAKEE